MKTHIHMKASVGVFVAALFIVDMGKQLKCLSTDERTYKFWLIHTVEYYSALERNEVLTHAITWMNLGNMMLK